MRFDIFSLGEIPSSVPSLSRSTDLSTDPGLKSRWIASPCLELAVASTKTLI
jgi:hypothetical protein